MFARVIKSKGYLYLVILETYRIEGKTKHKVIAFLGRIDKLNEKKELSKLAISLLKYSKENDSLCDMSKCKEIDRKNWGMSQIVKKLWEIYGLDKILKKIISGTKIKFDVQSAITLMLMDRINKPQSRRSSYLNQEKYEGINHSELQNLYKALDKLEENKEKIEEWLFEKNINLFNMKINVVLYDVTTLYFESTKQDELKSFGFSKDCKVNEVQIMLGLLIDLEGRPIGFEVFPGKTYEGATFKIMLDALKKRFLIDKIIVIADRGMMNKKNIEIIKSEGMEYIISSRIKNQPKVKKDEILDTSGFIETKDTDNEIYKYKKIENADDYLIITWSAKRANKDCKDRERLIEKAKKYQNKPTSTIPKKSSMKYLNCKTSVNGLNTDKINEDMQWDGFYGLQTNCKNLSETEIISHYHDLWRVEESFRLLKSHLEIRPIFLHSPKRIKGFLVLCFIAFLFERNIEIEVKKIGYPLSPNQIRDAINEMQSSTIEIENKLFSLCANLSNNSKAILDALNIKIPPNITLV